MWHLVNHWSPLTHTSHCMTISRSAAATQTRARVSPAIYTPWYFTRRRFHVSDSVIYSDIVRIISLRIISIFIMPDGFPHTTVSILFKYNIIYTMLIKTLVVYSFAAQLSEMYIFLWITVYIFTPNCLFHCTVIVYVWFTEETDKEHSTNW